MSPSSRKSSRKGSPTKQMSKKNRTRVYKNPYLTFVAELREELRGQKLRPKQVFEIAGKRWREMPEEQRQHYKDLAKTARKIRKRTGPKMAKKSKKYRNSESKLTSDKKRRRSRSTSSGSKTGTRTRSVSSYCSSEVLD